MVFLHAPPTVTSITISPSPATVALGSTQLFSATDQDGNQISVDWSSSDETVGTVSPATGTSTTFTALKAGAATVRATSGSVEGSASVTIPDEIPPITTISLSGTAGNTGWYRGDITVTLTAEDNEGGSGVAFTEFTLDGTSWQSYSGSFIIANEGTTTIGFRSGDFAGNTEQTKNQDIKLDKTAPTITGSRTPAANSNGWNNGDVTVHFDYADGSSGADSCTSDSVVSSEGEGQSVSGTVTDKAGNTASTTVNNINIDKTAPTISITTPVAYGLYTVGTALSFSASDILSTIDGTAIGVLTDTAGVTSSISSDYAPLPGVYTLIVEATDKAGNTAISDSRCFVVYDPAGGFATGGGWLTPDSDSTLPGGRANFGFVAKYKNGASTGNLEFQYKDAQINLKSTSIDWLVISDVSAQFQGTATINGIGPYTFRVNAKDNAEPGTGADSFDIRIWQGPETNTVHKAKNVISGGNIVVHKK